MGKINPINYFNSDKLIVAPFGVDGGEVPLQKTSPIKAIANDGSFKILWFGGVYPWFDLKILIEAIKVIRDKGKDVELVIVGAKNPFNNHPDFNASTMRVMQMAEQQHYRDFVHILDWVSYEDRFDYYLDSNLIVTLSREGIENRFAWRTRVLDYLQCLVPFATNGGDPVSDLMVDEGLGFKISCENSDILAKNLESIIDKLKVDTTFTPTESLKRMRDSLTWASIASKVIKSII